MRKKSPRKSTTRKQPRKSLKKSRALRSPRKSPKNQPLNKALYNRVKAEAKKRFKAWPSAYASGWLVKEYERRGGKYKGRSSRSQGLGRWFAEKWINVCELPRKVTCGRPKSNSNKNYPYCRPSVRVSKSTPKTVSEFTKQELKRRCSRKRRSPKKRVT
jgi:hypothetical protein